ncbi:MULTISPECIES: aminodeoxychorismate/anthranilate synthase component II [unclassified Pseudomonas]|uniref:anthranilate synthase component II n=1 Tax=unclassified Pseudomonas TaxID=196821 RepID=UPI00244C850A|nr:MULTISPECIES: aminodeoxychorismate/anthranilate synthase component II [unclassified Pseudomonas]MDH0304189.1 aminodeoxychorismate/anthranilate synthase component II [Pseudomonas sp. GD04091]MDH1986208.1 aminodeoxychorismate/anthranilate synthase component II [Pseudomonas sp. GD03689]
MKTLIVDNFDSFTYNLFQFMGQVCGEEPDVFTNDVSPADIDLNRYAAIIISPGPGTPARKSDIGLSEDVIRDASVPVLGVCLGHQCMAHLHGMDVVHAPEPMHGRLSRISHDGQGVFAGLPADLTVVRYHSLMVRQVKSPFVVSAWDQHGMIHGIRHKDRPLHGIQFHPESICTEAGLQMLGNFRDLAHQHQGGRC